LITSYITTFFVAYITLLQFAVNCDLVASSSTQAPA